MSVQELKFKVYTFSRHRLLLDILMISPSPRFSFKNVPTFLEPFPFPQLSSFSRTLSGQPKS